MTPPRTPQVEMLLNRVVRRAGARGPKPWQQVATPSMCIAHAHNTLAESSIKEKKTMLKKHMLLQKKR